MAKYVHTYIYVYTYLSLMPSPKFIAIIQKKIGTGYEATLEWENANIVHSESTTLKCGYFSHRKCPQIHVM